jgi:mono/diheme cytochrome c family protein
MKLSSRSNHRRLVLTALASIIVVIGCKTQYETSSEKFVPAEKASIERGKMLVQSSCAGCHYDPNTKHLSGKQFATPKIFGKVYTANLTQSSTQSPLSKYTEADFVYLMRTGISKEGHFITYMLRPNMSDADVSSMWAYLHSSDSDVQPVNAVAGTTNLNFLGNMGSVFLGKPLPYRSHVAAVDESNKVAYGRYLVDNIGCYHCHSKKGMLSLNAGNPEQTKGYLAGGRRFKMPNGVIRGANITNEKYTGIGDYTKEDFRKAVLQAVDKNGRKLQPPMKAFHYLSNRESDAIFAYIQSLGPTRHEVQ